MSMSACATATSSAPPCPELEAYSAREQIDAADELADLPEDSVLAKMMAGYLRLRDQIRSVCPATSADSPPGLY